MSGKRLAKKILLVCAILMLVGLGIGNEARGDVLKLTLSNPVPEKHPINKACTIFKQMVETWTNGQVVVTVYPANQLGNPSSTVEEVLSGTLDMTLVGTDVWQTFIKEAAVEMIPFAYDDQAHIDRVYSGPAGKKIHEIYGKNGVIRLSDWIWGFRQMTNNKKRIQKPEDVAGLKMRVPPTIQLQQMYRALGAVVTTIEFPELYMALSQGVADGQCNPLWVIWAFKLQEVQKHLSLTNHGYLTMPLVISKSSFDKLSDDQKIAVQKSAELAEMYLRSVLQASDDTVVMNLEKKGMTVDRPDRAAFKSKMGPVYEKVGEFAGKDWMSQWMKWVDEARAK